jgi:uncharacterized protein YkwD
MRARRFQINRRSFLTTAAPFALSLPVTARAQVLIERGGFGDQELPLVRERLLKQVNTERSAAGLGELQLDDLASTVATKHAHEMVEGSFLSHWGLDGSKPYQRYSFAGGTAAVQENCSSADDIESISPLRIFDDLRDMHQSMLDETPPNDGHRRTILNPFHTHVGFGAALKSHSLRLDEIYLARYVKLDPVVAEANPGATIVVSGHLINTKHFLNEIAVFYEPPLKPPDISWLRVLRSVSFPDDVVRLRPRVSDELVYSDGSHGDFDWNHRGWFHARVKLYKPDPGVYTIVCMIRRVPRDKGFPGGQVCVRSVTS